MIQINEYDSRFFKRDVYSISLLPQEQVPSELPDGLIIARIPAKNVMALQEAIGAGFEILCPMADLELSLENLASKEFGKNVRIAKLADSKEIIDIAGRCFSLSRFHREQTMSPQASEYHKEWVKNCLNGNQADIVLVSGESGNIDGFISISYHRQERKAKIVLIGVSPEK